jgi:hypothetical protein
MSDCHPVIKFSCNNVAMVAVSGFDVQDAPRIRLVASRLQLGHAALDRAALEHAAL